MQESNVHTDSHFCEPDGRPRSAVDFGIDRVEFSSRLCYLLNEILGCLCLFTCNKRTLKPGSEQQGVSMKGIIITCSLFLILLAFFFPQHTLCQNLGNFIRKMFEVAHSSNLFPRGGPWLVCGHIARTGIWVSCFPYVSTATESLKGSGFGVAENFALATESSSLWWSEKLVSFLFLHSSDIPGLKCFHLAQQNPAKHIRN